MFKNFKVSTKILMVTISVAVVSLIILQVVFYSQMADLTEYSKTAGSELAQTAANHSETSITDLVLENLSGEARDHSRLISMQLSRVSDATSQLATAMSQIPADENFTAQAQRIIDAMNINDIATQVNLLASNVQIYQYPPSSGDMLTDKIKQYYTAAMDSFHNGDYLPLWIDEHSSDELSCYLRCAKAYVGTNNHLEGVVLVDVPIRQVVFKALLPRELPGALRGFLLDDYGNIVAQSDFIAGDFQTRPLDGQIDETYRELLDKMKSGSSGISPAVIDGVKYYAAFEPVGVEGLSLALLHDEQTIAAAVSRSKNAILEHSDKMREPLDGVVHTMTFRFLFFSALCVFLIVLSGVFLSNTITLPLKRLTAGVKQIGKGNLSFKINADSRDEIGELAHSFNDMTDALNDYVSMLAKTAAEKQMIESELEVARKIQVNMLPHSFSDDRDEFDICAFMDPAKNVGGDFYDFFMLDDDHLAVVIADVSGKGVAAALFMVVAMTLIRNHANLGHTPAEVFNLVNRQLCKNNEQNMFVTAFMGIINIKNGNFVYANAGHNPPLVYKKETGEFDWLKVNPGFVLAGMEKTTYQSSEMSLSEGDMLCLYTDGVTEALNVRKELYSNERLVCSLSKLANKGYSISKILRLIRLHIDLFEGLSDRADDITMLMLKILTLPGYSAPANSAPQLPIAGTTRDLQITTLGSSHHTPELFGKS